MTGGGRRRTRGILINERCKVETVITIGILKIRPSNTLLSLGFLGIISSISRIRAKATHIGVTLFSAWATHSQSGVS
uniref:Pentatricopeptide repeat-containing protein n=1 Tax=Rhizophora mucronata TaxID=61149 RepID=A0A2P2JHL9_RHIMU